MRNDKIIYAINIKDVQNVAGELYGRNLTNDELNKIIDKVGNYFDWYDAIENAIRDNLNIDRYKENDEMESKE